MLLRVSSLFGRNAQLHFVGLRLFRTQCHAARGSFEHDDWFTLGHSAMTLGGMGGVYDLPMLDGSPKPTYTLLTVVPPARHTASAPGHLRDWEVG